MQPEQQKLFKTTGLEIPNFANTTSAIWGKFTISNDSRAKWILEIGNPLIDSISFYTPINGGYELLQTGAMFPHKTRSYKNNLFLFNLTTEQDTVRQKIFYFRLKTNFPLQVPLTISTLQPLLEENHRTDLGMGIYLGFMMVMALYNLFVFSSIKDKIYLYYVVYIVFITLLYANFKRYSFEFLWNETYNIN